MKIDREPKNILLKSGSLKVNTKLHLRTEWHCADVDVSQKKA